MIYLCIPAHDEARTLGVLLWKVRKVMKDFGRDYRVLVHDDGSSDGTTELLEKYKRVVPLDVTRASTPQGQGASLEVLLEHAVEVSPYPKRDVVVTLQGDFTEDPAEIVPMVKAIEGGADLVCGAVKDAPGKSRGRRFTEWARHRLLKGAIAGAPVEDPFCGVRAFRVIVLKKALRSESFGSLAGLHGPVLNLSLLRVLVPFARRLTELPVTARHDLRQRPSRLRILSELRALNRARHVTWLPGETEAA